MGKALLLALAFAWGSCSDALTRSSAWRTALHSGVQPASGRRDVALYGRGKGLSELTSGGGSGGGSTARSRPATPPPSPVVLDLEECPITPLPKDLSRAATEDPPGVAMKEVKAKHRALMPLQYFTPVNLDYPGLRLVHFDPMVFVVEDFFSAEECAEYISLSQDESKAMELESPTFAGGLQGRTSTTWFLHYSAAEKLVKRARDLLPGAYQRFEEPQIVRYLEGQQFRWHFDHVPDDAMAVPGSGGQRIATLLVYLNDVESGGTTSFRDLGISVKPKRGQALLFFPSFWKDGEIRP